MALLALTGYLAVTAWGSVTGWPLSVMILSLAYLWEAGVEGAAQKSRRVELDFEGSAYFKAAPCAE
jgi:hypothetical protein